MSDSTGTVEVRIRSSEQVPADAAVLTRWALNDMDRLMTIIAEFGIDGGEGKANTAMTECGFRHHGLNAYFEIVYDVAE